MKRIFCNWILITVCSTIFVTMAWSKVSIEVLDWETRQVRMTYEVEDDMSGNKEFRFPGGGFLHDLNQGEMKVESVFDVKDNFELQYSVQKVGEPPAPQLKIAYTEPIQSGETKVIRIQVVLFLPPENLYRDNSGRYAFEYETTHDFEMQLQTDHYLVFVNQPSMIYEKEGHVHVKQTSDKSRKIKVISRKMGDSLFGSN